MNETDKALLLKYDMKYGNTDQERFERYIENHNKLKLYHRVKTREFYRIKAKKNRKSSGTIKTKS